jgi:4-hydroxy-tetrahydrodipicolinate synthase
MPLPPHIAMVTPMNEGGMINYRVLPPYLHFLARQGVECLIVGGTTGEFFSLTREERWKLLEAVRGSWSGEIVVNVSATTVAEAKQHLEHAAGLVNAALCLPPYYFADAPEAGIIEFFDALLSATKLNFWLYDFPRHCGNRLTPAIVRSLAAAHAHLCGIKSSATLESAVELKKAAERLAVVVGNDRMALSALQNGLDGSVSGGLNPLARFLVGLYDSFSKGGDQAHDWQKQINSWSDLLASLNQRGMQEIPIVKVALSALIADFPTGVQIIHTVTQLARVASS